MVKLEVDTSETLHLIPATYLGNRHFSSKRRIFKHFFVALTIIEILSMPDLLALPVLYSFLLLMIFEVTKITSVRNRESFAGKDRDSHFIALIGKKSIMEWAMDKERLFTLTLLWQKIVMMI